MRIPMLLVVAAVCVLPISCGKSSGGGPGGPGSGEPIKFSLSGAVGVGQVPSTRDASSANRSNLRRVNTDGTTAEALSSGKATVSKFFIAPNGKLYVLFQSKTSITDSSSSTSGCLLGEVTPSTGDISCIDGSLSSIDWDTGGVYIKPNPIQFDSDGAIYYRGRSSNGQLVLRKFHNSQTTDLINDNIDIRHFTVLGDGSVIITGTTTSSNTNWIRRISPTGSLQNLVSGDLAQFLAKFPDGNVYMGVWGSLYAGVYRFLVAGATMDGTWQTPWIGGPGLNGNTYTPTNSVTGTPIETNSTFGAVIKHQVGTANGKVFATPMVGSAAVLMQYYPSLSTANTAVANVTVLQAIVNNLIVAGTTSGGANRLMLYDSNANTEQNLLPSNDIEIYHAYFVGSENKILFDGLNFATNKVVIGTINLASSEVLLVDLGSGAGARFDDFRTF